MKPTHFKCPSCKTVNDAGQWNLATAKLLLTREAKRTYVKIQDAGGRIKRYCCPNCDMVNDTRFIQAVKPERLGIL